MIGYNVGKIEELIREIANSYKSLGSRMCDGWIDLSRIMEAHWIGPDEVSYETQLASDICNLYVSCQSAVQALMNNVKILADDWRTFQKNNLLEGAAINVEGAGAFANEIEMPALETYSVSDTVRAGSPEFTKDTNLGLASGMDSLTTIKSNFDSYIEKVYNSVRALYSNCDSLIESAFIGAEVSSSLKTYLSTVAEGLAKLTTCHRSIYEALDTLLQRYQTHETNESTSINTSTQQESADTAFNGQNLK